jgi:hypothetical protein
MGPQPENSLGARFLCVKDFLKRLLCFPAILVGKILKTALRLVLIPCAALLVLLTLGSSAAFRKLFVDRIVTLAKDLADWVLMPFAITLCFLRLLLALFIHPDFYFNAI